MKILYFSPHPHLNLSSSTGYGRHMREMIAAFRKQGHEVHTLIIGGEKPVESNVNQPGFLKRLVKKITPSLLWETIKDYQLIRLDKTVKEKLLAAIKQFNPDIIYERGYYLMPSGAIVAKEKKIKHILEINAPYIEERFELQGKSLLLKKASQDEKEQIDSTNLLVVVSSPLKNYFIKKHAVASSKILITPNAVNFDDVNVNENTVLKLKQELNLNGKTCIGFVGSIFPYHGVDLLISAFESLKKEIAKDCILLIIGDGETLEELKRSVNKKGLQNNIIFTGKIPHNEIYNYIQLFDIAMMAKTNWYCSPIKIFEYGALQKPIIAPDTQSVKDVLTNNEDGLLIQPYAAEIANAIMHYTSNKERRLQHGLSFYSKIKEQHTWEAVAKKILSNLQ